MNARTSQIKEWSAGVEVITSIDAFEHYDEPGAVLEMMRDLLVPGGTVYVSFGPPWWHPYGCHMAFMNAPPGADSAPTFCPPRLRAESRATASANALSRAALCPESSSAR